MVSWQYLLLGGLGAMGAALALGTIAALIRYWRTGVFPGQPEDAEPVEVTRGQLFGLWLRIVIGLALAVWGLVSLIKADLL